MEQTEKTIYQLWKDLKIGYAKFIFDCGGDSMGDTRIEFYDDKGQEIEQSEELTTIENHIDREIYNKVDFWVNSDGHYLGEFGEVTITLEEEDDEEFTYIKNSQAEYEEWVSGEIEVVLTDEELEFIKTHISNINGNADEMDINFNYKKDFLLNDKIEKLLDEIKEKIWDEIDNFTPEETKGELVDGYAQFSTNSFEDEEDTQEVKINVDAIKVSVRKLDRFLTEIDD